VTEAGSRADNTIAIPSYTPRREIQELLPAGLSRFVVFSTAASDAAHITSTLPPYCRVETAISTALDSTVQQLSSSSASNAFLKALVSKALDQSKADLAAAVQTAAEIGVNLVTLGNLSTINNEEDPLSVVHWSSVDSSLVPARVARLDSKPLFKSDKAYWLVGLTRDLGLSICEWMIAHGAKYIAITSRNPQVDPVWEESCRRKGAVIKIYAK
jgi:hybrid polyketide synthase/nonribosomal peptide synthetase ACE1